MWLDLSGSSSRTSTPAAGRVLERVDEVLVGQEVGLGQPDVAAGPVDRLEIHPADREHPQPRDVALDPDQRLPRRGGLQQQRALRGPEPAPPVEVPEVRERALEVPHGRPGDPDVRVAPLRLVGGSDVVAADEAGVVVDDQDLAVVAAVAAEVEEPPAGGVDGIAQHLHRRREPLERRRHHQVGEPVVDAVDLDAAVRRGGQGALEPLPRRVALPDVGLEEDLPLGAVDRRDHVVVQVATEGVRRHLAVTDRDRRGRPRRERLRPLAAPPVGVDQRHGDREADLDPEDRQQESANQPRDAHAVALSVLPSHGSQSSDRCRVRRRDAATRGSRRWRRDVETTSIFSISQLVAVADHRQRGPLLGVQHALRSSLSVSRWRTNASTLTLSSSTML